MILWSIHTFLSEGLATKNKQKSNLKKIPFSLKNSSPGSKVEFSEKLLFGIWKLILGRYNIK